MRNEKPVLVRQLAARLERDQAQTFLREMESFLKSAQPRLVLDLSRVRRMDSAGVDMLLRCLQEVMRRDGDMKLASVSQEAAVVLELTRLDRLFEIFDSTADAVESFFTFPVSAGTARPQTHAADAVAELDSDLRAAS